MEGRYTVHAVAGAAADADAGLPALAGLADPGDARDGGAHGAWVRREFLLTQDLAGPLQVPSPAAGIARRLGTHGGIEIRASAHADAALLARVLCMEPRSLAVADGARVAYGQPLGRQWGAGADGRKLQSERTRIETRAARLDRYLHDLAAGTIAPGRYPGQPQLVAPDAVPDTDAYRVWSPNTTDAESDAAEDAFDDDDDADAGANAGGNARASDDVDGAAADAQALDALRKRDRQPLVSNPDHPDHALYRQALAGLEALDPSLFRNAQERSNAAAMLVLEARIQGLRQIDHVTFDADGGALAAVQGGLRDDLAQRAVVEKAQAARQSVERSSADLERERALERQRQLEQQRQLQWQLQLQEEQRARRRGWFRG